MELSVDERVRAAHARLTLVSAADDAPRAVALVASCGARSFAELASEVGTRARDLAERARGLARPIVFEPLGADAESLLLVLACIEAGVPFAGVHPRWTEAERATRRATLAGASRLEVHALAATPDPLGGKLGPSPEAPAAVLFTSGTTGAPRGIVLARRAFAAAAVVSQRAIPLAAGDRWLLSMPLAHVGGASIVARCLVARAALVLDDEGPFVAARWHARVVASGTTHASIVPTMLKRIVELDAARPDSLRHLVVGGAACDPSLVERARALGYPVQRTWGMTETCAMIATETAPRDGGAGVVRALEGITVRARGGVLGVRTPALASGYWTDAGVAPLPADEDGFFETGDVGAVASNGVVDVHGRRDDVIVTGGENVHPAEVEAALLAVEGVAAAAVFGEADPEWGQIVVAAVVLESGAAIAAGAPAALTEAIRGRLARFKRPRAFIRVEAAPLLPSGKVDRRALIARALELRARQGAGD